MKTLFLGFFILMFSIAKGQAHLGATEYTIKNLHSSNIWNSGITNSGQKYINTSFDLGSFTYYFDKETGLSSFCIQIPKNIPALNAQVEIYNKKYVITSDTSWTAYLEEGGIMYIKLKYEPDYKISVFTYSNVKQ